MTNIWDQQLSEKYGIGFNFEALIPLLNLEDYIYQLMSGKKKNRQARIPRVILYLHIKEIIIKEHAVFILSLLKIPWEDEVVIKCLFQLCELRKKN
jgi:hypothetical protein